MTHNKIYFEYIQIAIKIDIKHHLTEKIFKELVLILLKKFFNDDFVVFSPCDYKNPIIKISGCDFKQYNVYYMY